MAGLPVGTVTFLFTDIEGSTRLLHELGAEGYAEALAEHRRALREAFARSGGVEVDTQGDAFFYAFPTAPAALEAAANAQDALRSGPVAVRMGVHTGTPVVTEEGYVGEDVHRAARIAAVGHGGQVLVSAATAALVPGEGLRDLGDYRLKDLSAPERILQLGHGDFAPLETLYRTNLPVPATAFLGREPELAEVTGLLGRADVRLLTLTGPGGTGKTRLALQAAGAVSGEFPDGVWWISLAPLRDARLVLSTAARVAGATGPLAEHVGAKRLLLLFDNFEHLVDASNEIAGLVAACPNLTVLVTSRERLHLAAELEYAVSPFEEPDAIEFFYARARAISPHLVADEAVPAICRRLDNLPLALDLAAVRVKALTPAQILERLEQRLPLLTGGARDLPERQRTLRATIEWSHDLLGDDERQLLRRLSVFRGGCALDAAEEVAGADVETLQSLVDKSLLRHSGGRFWMLESIREYAHEQLVESSESDELQEHHAEYVVSLARRARLVLEPSGKQDFSLAAPELDNIRAALEWLRDNDPIRALGLAACLEMLWAILAPDEGMRWLESLLDVVEEAPPALRGQAYLTWASASHPAGDDALPELLYERSLAAFREAGDERGIGILLFRLANNAFYRKDYQRAAALAEESLALHRRLENVAGEAQAVALMGELAHAQGDPLRGAELIERSAYLAGQVGFTWWRSRMLRKLVDCLLELGRVDEAEAHGRESLTLMHDIGDHQMVVFTLARLARIAIETGQVERAGLLWGAIEAEERRSPMGAWSKEREHHASRVLAHAGPELERGRRRGSGLTLDEAVEAALGASPVRDAAPSVP
jgi:predicted ATPase